MNETHEKKVEAKHELIKLLRDEICGFDDKVAAAALLEVLVDTWFPSAKKDTDKLGLPDIGILNDALGWANVSTGLSTAIDMVCQDRAYSAILSARKGK